MTTHIELILDDNGAEAVDKIGGIKILKTSFGVGLKEAKELYEAVRLNAIKVRVTDAQFGRFAARVSLAAFADRDIGIYWRIDRVIEAPCPTEYDYTSLDR